MVTSETLWGRIVIAGGIKRICAAVGRDDSTVYRWAGPDERGPLDWFEAVIQILAMRPDGRGALVELQHWFNALFERALRVSEPSPTSLTTLRADAISLLREAADVIEHCPPRVCGADRQKLTRETLEVRAMCDRILGAVEAGLVD